MTNKAQENAMSMGYNAGYSHIVDSECPYYGAKYDTGFGRALRNAWHAGWRDGVIAASTRHLKQKRKEPKP